MPIAEQITAVITGHGEGPVWWPDDGSPVAGRLRCVDLLAGSVVTVDANGATRADVGSPVAAFVRPRAGGGAIVATEHGLSLSDHADLSDLRPWMQLVEDPAVRFNDGGCAPDGALYGGTMRYDEGPGGGALYRVTADARPSTVLDDVTISNGLAWTADGVTAYYNDTPTRTTWTFDWDPARGLHERRPMFRLDDDATGVGPDGLCVDSRGTVWTAIFGGSRVEARDPGGRLVEVVELPVSQVTACTFGGPQLRTLFITTSSEGLAEDQEPEAGAVFAIDVGVAGQPVAPFGGQRHGGGETT